MKVNPCYLTWENNCIADLMQPSENKADFFFFLKEKMCMRTEQKKKKDKNRGKTNSFHFSKSFYFIYSTLEEQGRKKRIQHFQILFSFSFSSSHQWQWPNTFTGFTHTDQKRCRPSPVPWPPCSSICSSWLTEGTTAVQAAAGQLEPHKVFNLHLYLLCRQQVIHSSTDWLAECNATYTSTVNFLCIAADMVMIPLQFVSQGKSRCFFFFLPM